MRDVLRHKASAPNAAARRAHDAMEVAFPEALIEGHDHLEAALEGIPDPDDRHGVAAALHAGAAQIITNNLRDFPIAVMEHLQIDVRRMLLGLKRPELTPAELLIRMERNGLGQTAALLARRMELW